jgi:hypothetical protein
MISDTHVGVDRQSCNGERYTHADDIQNVFAKGGSQTLTKADRQQRCR